MNNLLTYWQFNITALVGLLLLSVGYVIYHQYRISRGLQWYGAALLLLVICFFSPLHILSAHYLFSAHMLVHVLLLLVAGPLLVLALQKENTDNRLIQFISRKLSKKPLMGWLAGVAIMWFWHIPAVFNFCMVRLHEAGAISDVVHAVESGSLIVSGMLFSWPFLGPVQHYRLPALSGIVYLFTACIGCSLLGLIITFAPTGIYRFFLSAHDSYGINAVLLNDWGINQTIDQQIAGLIMWVPCCLLYVIYSLFLLGRWFGEKEPGQLVDNY